jgi:hypothetical protein
MRPISEPAATAGLPPEDIAIMRAVYEQMCCAAPEARALFAQMIGDLRRKAFAAITEAPSEEAARIAAALSTEGVVDLGILVDAARAAEMLAHFRPAPLYAAHVLEHADGVARNFDEVRRSAHYGCYAREHVLGCPYLIEIANDPRLLQVAEAYLGCPPTIYNLNAWWSFPQSQTPARYSQSLHRDIEELRFLTLFIYLTPVDDRNGPHRYIKHSHSKAALTHALIKAGWHQGAVASAINPLFVGNGYAQSAQADALLGNLAMVWKGASGSAILADTYGLHMGIPPADGERLMAWVRYGLGPNCGSFDGGAGTYADIVRPRIAPTERARYINRLLLAA